MRRSGVEPTSILLGLLLFGTACRNGDTTQPSPVVDAQAAPQVRVAELYFTTELSGYIEPCGCTSEPLGGIQRLATILRGGSDSRGLVDAGDLLFPTEGLDATTMDQHLLKARILSRTYRELGAVALNVGASDLAGGAELLKELQREGAVPWVSANVRPTAEAGPSIARSFVRELGGIKIGMTGVATPESFAKLGGVAAIEYVPALRAETKRLKEQGAELIVVLAHVEEGGATELAGMLPDVDVIIRAPGTPITRKPSAPKRVGSVVIAEAGSQGQHVGRITFRLGPGVPKRPLGFDDGGLGRVRERELLERKLRALRRQIEELGSKPEQAAGIAGRKAQVDRLQVRLASLSKPVPVPIPSIQVELIPLSLDVSADPDMTQLLTAYYAQLKDMNTNRGDVSLCKVTKKDQAVFVGTDKCKECHEDAWTFWKKTKHGSAWETLEKDNKQYDLTCIGCHTVGYKMPGGFCRIADVGALQDVGCEMCHGPGSLHTEDEDPSSIQLEVTAATCRDGCHVPEHSDAFDFPSYLTKITGEGHELSAPPSAP